MSKLTPILTLRQSAEATVTWTMQRLQLYGFQVERTFDLQAARVAQDNRPCSHHGTKDCTCQMVVLVVHSESQFATVVAHGQDDCISLSLVDGEDRSVDERVFHALLPADGAMGS